MKIRILSVISAFIFLIGCGKNNAAEENFGYCFGYHQIIKKDEKSLTHIFQPLYLQMNTELAQQFAMRWIQEYLMAPNDGVKQSLITNAKRACRELNIPE